MAVKDWTLQISPNGHEPLERRFTVQRLSPESDLSGKKKVSSIVKRMFCWLKKSLHGVFYFPCHGKLLLCHLLELPGVATEDKKASDLHLKKEKTRVKFCELKIAVSKVFKTVTHMLWIFWYTHSTKAMRWFWTESLSKIYQNIKELWGSVYSCIIIW